jgi:hypothetical protein
VGTMAMAHAAKGIGYLLEEAISLVEESVRRVSGSREKMVSALTWGQPPRRALAWNPRAQRCAGTEATKEARTADPSSADFTPNDLNFDEAAVADNGQGVLRRRRRRGPN